MSSSFLTPDEGNGCGGFTLVEVVVVLSLVLVFSLSALPFIDLVSQRDKEEELRTGLLEMRGALDLYHQEAGVFPASIGTLIETPRSDGGFYLRRFPLNPINASHSWEIASRTTLNPAADYWFGIKSAGAELPDGTPIVDIRSPDLGTGINGISYAEW